MGRNIDHSDIEVIDDQDMKYLAFLSGQVGIQKLSTLQLNMFDCVWVSNANVFSGTSPIHNSQSNIHAVLIEVLVGA